MSKAQYKSEFHPKFFDTLDNVTEHMTDEQFEMFYELFNHQISVLEKNPYNNSRECEYGILNEQGFRTISFHSKVPRVGTGDLRIIFKVDEDDKINLYFAVGKRINKRPRPAEDIYSQAESMLKDIEEKNS